MFNVIVSLNSLLIKRILKILLVWANKEGLYSILFLNKTYFCKYIYIYLFFLQSKVCPFLIDPSFRATEWLKTHLKESHLEVINQQVQY